MNEDISFSTEDIALTTVGIRRNTFHRLKEWRKKQCPRPVAADIVSIAVDSYIQNQIDNNSIKAVNTQIDPSIVKDEAL